MANNIAKEREFYERFENSTTATSVQFSLISKERRLRFCPKDNDWRSVYLTDKRIKTANDILKFDFHKSECIEINHKGGTYYICEGTIYDFWGRPLVAIGHKYDDNEGTWKTYVLCYNEVLYDNKNWMYYFIRKYILYYAVKEGAEINFTSNRECCLHRITTPSDITEKIAKLNGI